MTRFYHTYGILFLKKNVRKQIIAILNVVKKYVK